PHVFERFYRAERSRSREGGGTGVGLAISRALVEAMGGEIEARSPGPEQGASFSFILPVAYPGS
ncbi:MAG: ATP-binding protein, partial [Rubrobacteraceae bacterium]